MSAGTKKAPKGYKTPGGFHIGTFWQSFVMEFSTKVKGLA